MKKLIALPAAIAVLLFISLMTASCSDTSIRQTWRKMPGNGPPAHAKAHGRRRKEATELEIIYDKNLDIYIVVDLQAPLLLSRPILPFQRWKIPGRYDSRRKMETRTIRDAAARSPGKNKTIIKIQKPLKTTVLQGHKSLQPVIHVPGLRCHPCNS